MKITFLRIFAVILALILFAVPYQHCMRGIGYGFPFAWYHPGHDEWGEYVLTSEAKFSDVIDFVNISISFALWGAIIGFLSWLRNMLKQRNS